MLCIRLAYDFPQVVSKRLCGFSGFWGLGISRFVEPGERKPLKSNESYANWRCRVPFSKSRVQFRCRSLLHVPFGHASASNTRSGEVFRGNLTIFKFCWIIMTDISSIAILRVHHRSQK